MTITQACGADTARRYRRACDYAAAAMIYLRDNVLLREPLRREHLKPRLLGHWGTCPGVGTSDIWSGHMLSPREQRALADIERWFAASDPHLAARLRDGTRLPGLHATRPVLLSVTALGVLLVLLGLATATATLFLAGLAAFATALSMRAIRRRRGNADDVSRSDEPLV